MSTVCWIAIFLGAFLLWFTKFRRWELAIVGLGYLVALITHQLAPIALLPIGLLLLAGYGLKKEISLPYRVAANVLFIALALALSLHWLPGFYNPKVIGPVRFTPDAAPFTLYLNLDKPLAGFFLLLAFPHLLRLDTPAQRWTKSALLFWSITSIVCLGFALSMGFLKWEPKLPSLGWLWMLNNLLLVVPTEEALFRGYLQGGLEATLGKKRLALLIASLLFGLAHFAGGWQWIVLASIAGVGYGLAYRAGGLRASMLTHFGLNLLHFTLFTYPIKG